MMASAMERQPATLVTPPGQNKSLNFTVCKYVRAFHQKTTTVNITFQLPAQRGQLTAWTHKTTRVSFLLVWAYSKMTIAGFIRHTLWKSGSASMRHYFHTWIGHHRVQTLTPLTMFGMCWRRRSTHQYKILVRNTALGRNEWIFIYFFGQAVYIFVLILCFRISPNKNLLPNANVCRALTLSDRITKCTVNMPC